METKHTPGPGHLSDYYSDALTVLDAGGFEIVSAKGIAILQGYSEKLRINHWADSPDASRDISEEEQAANARLIAAAPELLKELDRLLSAVMQNSDADQTELGLKPFIRPALAAIAKATGA